MKITKKLISYALLFVGAMLFCGLKSKATINAATTSNDTNGLGYAINIVKASSPTSFNLGAPIIREDYLQNVSFVKTSRLIGKKVDTYDTNIRTILANLEAFYNGSIYGGVTYEPFSTALTNHIKGNLSINFRDYMNRYFGCCLYDYVRYEMALPSYSDFANTYQNYYSSAFLNKLSSLDPHSSKESYFNFFDSFGTHVVANVLVGGKLRMNYIVVSNTLQFGVDVKASIKNAMKSAVDNLGKSNKSTELVFGTGLTQIISSCTYSTDIEVMGGNLSYALSLENRQGTNYTNWINSINDSNSVTIGYGTNGLVPIWDVLPTSYSSLKTTMKNYFNTYYDENIDSSKSNFIYSGQKFTGGVEATNEKVFSTIPITITDAGRMKNKYVEIDLKELLGVYPSTMINEGFTEIKIKLTFEFREIDDGYRHLFIFPTNGTENVNAYIADYDFYTENAVLKNWTKHIAEMTFSIDKLNNEKIYLRFGASGSGDDDWQIRNIKTSFIVS